MPVRVVRSPSANPRAARDKVFTWRMMRRSLPYQDATNATTPTAKPAQRLDTLALDPDTGSDPNPGVCLSSTPIARSAATTARKTVPTSRTRRLNILVICDRRLFALKHSVCPDDVPALARRVFQRSVSRLEPVGPQSQVSGLRSQVSGLRSQVSGLRSQVSGFRSQVSGFRFQVSWSHGLSLGRTCLFPPVASNCWRMVTVPERLRQAREAAK